MNKLERLAVVGLLALAPTISGCSSLGRSYLNPSNPKHKQILEEAQREANEQLKNHPSRGKLGFIHTYENTVHGIVKEKHGLYYETLGERAAKDGTIID